MPKLSALIFLCVLLPHSLRAESLLAIDSVPVPFARAASLEGRFFAGNQSIAVVPAWQENWPYRMRSDYRSTPAVFVAQTALSLQHQGWNLALLQRQQAYLEATPDTWKLAQEQKNQSMVAGTEYTVDFEGEYFSANAFKLSHAWQAGAWEARLAASYLKGMRYRREYGVGHARAANAEDLSAKAVQERQYSGLNAGNPEVFNTYLAEVPVDGRGYSFDLALGWRAASWRFMLAAADIGGRINWQGMPSMVRTGEFAFSADGSFIGRPDGSASVVEQDARVDFQQRLPLKLAAVGAYVWPQWQAELRVEKINQLTLPQIAILYPLTQDWRLRGAYESRFGSWELGVVHRWLALSVRSNDLSMSRATALGAALVLSAPF